MLIFESLTTTARRDVGIVMGWPNPPFVQKSASLTSLAICSRKFVISKNSKSPPSSLGSGISSIASMKDGTFLPSPPSRPLSASTTLIIIFDVSTSFGAVRSSSSSPSCFAMRSIVVDLHRLKFPTLDGYWGDIRPNVSRRR